MKASDPDNLLPHPDPIFPHIFIFGNGLRRNPTTSKLIIKHSQ